MPEVLIVIVLMGIVFAIASSTWFGVVESRAVDSAANQIASDLRLAHTRATNQLRDWQVVLDSSQTTYQIGPTGETPDTRTLPDGTEVDTAVSFTFSPDGSVSSVPASVTSLEVRATDNQPGHNIHINQLTSRVKID